jgi:beta-N-acetylhexosaminidase
MTIGKLFMFGFDGTQPTDGILNFIRNDKISGVILFRRNFKSAEQLKKLTADLQDAADGNLLIGIDQEGGRVANLPTSIIDIPPMEKLGMDYIDGNCVDLAHELGFTLGEKLKLLGFNLDFAPVLDVNTNHDNPIIGNRAFSGDPEVVAKLGCELVRGMTEAGVIACGKHFPGHGDTSEDSHETLPHLNHDMKRLNSVEILPFKEAIDQKIPTLMSAHVVYEGVDPGVPATLSKKILHDILRGTLGYNGVLFSDDMEMDAIAKNYDIADASVRAVNAGCDITLICHTEDRQRLALDAVKKAAESGAISKERIQESCKRIKKLTTSFLV